MNWILEALKKTFRNMLKLSFITWFIVLLVAIQSGNCAKLYDFPFLTFTAALIGLKLYFKDTSKETK